MKPFYSRATLFIVITLVVVSAIIYLGYRTIAHEVLLRHYQQQNLAQSRSAQVEQFIQQLLHEKEIRLSAIAHYMEQDDASLQEIKSKDSNIDNLFILDKDTLIYPNEQNPLSQKDQEWVRIITPIIHDPSLLYSHSILDERSLPQSGWFIGNDNEQTLLIYWYNLGGKTLGFKVPYVVLLSDVINQTTFDYSPDALTVKENGRLLYQSGNEDLVLLKNQVSSRYLPYPLASWKISYYAGSVSTATLWLWGLAILALTALALTLVVYRIYREYNRSIQLARQQVNFVGQVSHELKTPLTNIALYAEILKDEPFDDESSAPRYLDVIVSETQRLSRLIQNILSFTKAPKAHFKTVDLNALLGQIYQTFLPAFRAKDMLIKLSISEDITVMSDIDRLTQIISNFLSNAEKYARHGKQVDLSAKCDDRFVYIEVRDYGNGISTKEFKNIFQPFYRIKCSITEGVSGTGIGLAIAQQLAHNLQGEIKVENCSPGASFTLKLPLVIETH